MKVAIVQHDIVWEDREANFARLRPRLAAAAATGARLAVLTETFSTGFGRGDRIAEAEHGPSSTFLAEQATSLGLWVCGSCPEVPAHSPDGRPFNTLVLAGPGGEVHRYRKVHPFTFSGEHEHFNAGSELVTVTVEDLRLSLFVCYDLRFADEFWNLASTTDAYVVVANWPEARRAHWQALLAARAIENQAYVIGCNRVGEGGGLAYAGDSRIVDPLGEVVAGGARGEALLVAEVSADHVADVRTRFPFLRDRRSLR
jgi:predicted amidohydrolase